MKDSDREIPNNFNPGQNSKEKRRAAHDIQSLSTQMNEIHKAYQNIKTSIEVMEKLGISLIVVDGAAKYQHGIRHLNEYLSRVRMGIAKIALSPVKDPNENQSEGD